MPTLPHLAAVVGVNVHRFRRRADSDSWLSISPVRHEDGRIAGIGVTGPRRGLALYRHRPHRA